MRNISLLLAITALIAAVTLGSQTTEQNIVGEWTTFKQTYGECLDELIVTLNLSFPKKKENSLFKGKSYSPSEDSRRMAIFAANLALINQHNSDPNRTYDAAVNQFTDMTSQELSERLGYASSL